MKKYFKSNLKDGLFTLAVLLAALLVSFALDYLLHVPTMITDVFILGVFVIAVKTPGLFWSVLASFASVLAVNFVFTFPYYAFDFFIAENLTSAIIMLLVAVTTSTLTRRIKDYERENAEVERERIRANLLRAVSHDLRTPLTTIYGSSSAVIENYDSLDREQKLKLLGEIREDSEWLIRMVENLLSVTRIGSDQVQISKISTVLDELIDTVLVKFAKRYPAQHVEVELPDEFVSIPMDPMLVTQVLINLLENAMLHAKGMTHLWLRVHLKGSIALFEISDDGCGIAKDKLPTLFTGSPEISGSPSDGKRSNMGIGLSVCSAILHAHGGQIWAENNREGGASIYFTLRTEAAADEQ